MILGLCGAEDSLVCNIKYCFVTRGSHVCSYIVVGEIIADATQAIVACKRRQLLLFAHAE